MVALLEGMIVDEQSGRAAKATTTVSNMPPERPGDQGVIRAPARPSVVTRRRRRRQFGKKSASGVLMTLGV
jgi:hypothetical protein